MASTHLERAHELIEKYIDLIDTNQFEDFYININAEIPDNHSALVGMVSYVLESANIYPLDHLSYVPKHYAAYRQDLETIRIPDHITAIDNGAFKFCSNLNAVEFPEGLEIIGCEAFAACTHLPKIKLPSTLVKIDRQAFFNCADLRDYNFNDGLKEIGAHAFWGTRKTIVEIPSSVSMIGNKCWGTMKMTFQLHRGAPVLGVYVNGHIEYID